MRASCLRVATPKAGLFVSRQCTLLGIARSSFYYWPRPESAEELDLVKRLNRIFTDHPVSGSRRLQVALSREGVPVGPSARPAADEEARAVGGQAEAEHQQAEPRGQDLSVLLRGKVIDQPNQPSRRDIGVQVRSGLAGGGGSLLRTRLGK